MTFWLRCAAFKSLARSDAAPHASRRWRLRARLSSSPRPRARCPTGPRLDLGGADGAGGISSFWIHQIRLVGPWSPIHLLSIFTLVMLPLGVWMAHRHQVADHRRIMILRFPARWSSPGCSRCCRDGSCTRSCSVIEDAVFEGPFQAGPLRGPAVEGSPPAP